MALTKREKTCWLYGARNGIRYGFAIARAEPDMECPDPFHAAELLDINVAAWEISEEEMNDIWTEVADALDEVVAGLLEANVRGSN